MKQVLLIAGLVFQLFVSTQVLANKSEFPGRVEFPEVAVMSMAQLQAKFNDVVIVDARSSYEYETLRIKGALNISVAASDFNSKVLKLRKNTTAAIVFYCNGRTCFKSYKAVEKAKKAGVSNVFAYDAGMFEWAKANPKKSVLRNISPINTSDIISKDSYKSRLLDAQAFINKARKSDKSTLVLDIRDMYQRAGISFFPGKERWASLDQKKRLVRYLKSAFKKNKTILVYDEVGKQAYWFQYALEEAGIKDYYFMKGGARSYYKIIENKVKAKI